MNTLFPLFPIRGPHKAIMGTCSCDGDARDSKQVDLQDDGSILPKPNPNSRVSAGAPASQSVEVEAVNLDPPEAREAQAASKPSYTRQNVVDLQSFARIFLKKRELSRASGGLVDWSDDEGLNTEAEGEAFIDPTTLLSPEARAVLQRKDPLQLNQGVKKVAASTARYLPDRSIYVGQWCVLRNGNWVRKGKGKMYGSDGGYREGYWKNGKLHHWARVIMPNGDWYEGGFNRGMKEGKGREESYDGRTWYDGDWHRDAKNGRGVEQLPDGARYEGDFVNSQKTGRGHIWHANGNEYEGGLTNGIQDGQGHYMWKDGRDYTGGWSMGKMHGNGIFKYADGKEYNGDYVLDKKQGYGVYKWDGKTYEGQWDAGKMHGEGWMTTEKGRKKYKFTDGNRGAEIQA